MGVIDLDARVKKLEQEGAGGAVIDQLEAAVTSLDETVNGNGTTDLGLVGDVSELQTAITPTRTAVTELTNGTPGDASSGGVFYEVIGNIVHIHVAAFGFTGGTRATAFTLPSSLRPTAPAINAVYATANTNPATGYIFVGVNGNVDVITAAGGDIYGDTWFSLTPSA